MFDRLNKKTTIELLSYMDDHIDNLNRTRGKNSLEFIVEIENILEILRARVWQELETSAKLISPDEEF